MKSGGITIVHGGSADVPSAVFPEYILAALKAAYAEVADEWPVPGSDAERRFQREVSSFEVTTAAMERLIVFPEIRYPRRFRAHITRDGGLPVGSPAHLKRGFDKFEAKSAKEVPEVYDRNKSGFIRSWLSAKIDNLIAQWGHSGGGIGEIQEIRRFEHIARSLAIFSPAHALGIISKLDELYESALKTKWHRFNAMASDVVPVFDDVAVGTLLTLPDFIIPALLNRQWLIELAERRGDDKLAFATAGKLLSLAEDILARFAGGGDLSMARHVHEAHFFARLALARYSSERIMDDPFGALVYRGGDDQLWASVLVFAGQHSRVPVDKRGPAWLREARRIGYALEAYASRQEQTRNYREAGEMYIRSALTLALSVTNGRDVTLLDEIETRLRAVLACRRMDHPGVSPMRIEAPPEAGHRFGTGTVLFPVDAARSQLEEARRLLDWFNLFGMGEASGSFQTNEAGRPQWADSRWISASIRKWLLDCEISKQEGRDDEPARTELYFAVSYGNKWFSQRLRQLEDLVTDHHDQIDRFLKLYDDTASVGLWVMRGARVLGERDLYIPSRGSTQRLSEVFIREMGEGLQALAELRRRMEYLHFSVSTGGAIQDSAGGGGDGHHPGGSAPMSRAVAFPSPAFGLPMGGAQFIGAPPVFPTLAPLGKIW